jgi:hypothetical protein
MANIGSCFVCGTPAQYAHFYDESVGHFVIGGEPRLCAACNNRLYGMSIEERRMLFTDFEVTVEPPTGRDVLGDLVARGEEFKRRERN